MAKQINLFKEYAFPFGLAILPIFSVFFPSKWTGPFLAVLILLFLFEKSIKENFNRNKKYIAPYLIFLIFCVITTLFSKDFGIAIKSLERYLSLIVVPALIFFSNLTKKRLKFIFKLYVLSLLLVSIISVGRLAWFINTFEDWIEVMRKVNNNDTYVQFKYPHLMWDVHPSYWSYLMIVGNIILLNNTTLKKPFSKTVSIILLLILNLNLLYLSARLPILVNIIIHFLVFTKIFFKRIKFLILLIIGSLVVILIAYFQLPFFRYKIEAIAFDDRFFLWSIAYKQIKNNYFILGEGLGKAKFFIANKLSIIQDTRVEYKGNEIHNQYLSILLEIGIFGFLSMLYVYVCTGLICLKKIVKSSLPSISIIVLVLLASIIEPFFNVIKGIIIFALFSALFKLQKSNDLLKDE